MQLFNHRSELRWSSLFMPDTSCNPSLAENQEMFVNRGQLSVKKKSPNDAIASHSCTIQDVGTVARSSFCVFLIYDCKAVVSFEGKTLPKQVIPAD